MIFLNSASSAAALVFYLPGMCTHTDGTEGVGNILKSSGKNTIFNEHPVHKFNYFFIYFLYLVSGVVGGKGTKQFRACASLSGYTNKKVI